MVFCLRANEGRPLFGWFDLTNDEKKALKLDNMMRGLAQYYAVVNHMRNEMLRANLISFVKGNIK